MSARQSCARTGCGASLRRSRCASTPLRCSCSWPHRGTRFVRFALYARTTAMNQLTKRASRAAMSPVLLSVAEARHILPERSFAEGWFVVRPKTENPASRKSALRRYVGSKTKSLHSRQAVSGGGDFCGGEEHSSGVGARSALRNLTRCGCPNGESEANAVSSAARPRSEHRSGVDTKCDRRSMSPRRVPPAATRASSAKND